MFGALVAFWSCGKFRSQFAAKGVPNGMYLRLSENGREIHLSVQSHSLALTKGYRDAVRRILVSALGRFAGRIRAIQVWLEDVNGPRGGADIRCRIGVDRRPRGQISVSALATDEFSATAKAAVRTRELVDRRVKRTRALCRQIHRV
jgi:hypothetical protein